MDTEFVDIHAGVLENFPRQMEKVIVGLHAIGFPVGRPDAFSDNHAVLFLTFANDEGCVRFDMGHKNLEGLLMVKAHDYQMSKTVLWSHTLRPAEGQRVQDFWQAIEQDNLHLFRFDVTLHDDGEDEIFGCRNWVYVNLLR
jgi:hypothetical protein